MTIMRFFSNLLRWFIAGGKSASTSKSHVFITSDKLTINASAKFDNLLNIADKNSDCPWITMKLQQSVVMLRYQRAS